MPSRPTETAAELLEGVRGGSAEAWERFVERYERLVYSVPRRMGLDEEDARDVAQATWLLLYRHVQHVQRPRSLASWIITTTAREAARFRERAQSRRDRELERGDGAAEPPVLPDEVAERLERIQAVRDAIAVLEDRCRELLTRTDLEGASYKQTAESLGMPLGSVGPTRLRCLAKLADLLSERDLP